MLCGKHKKDTHFIDLVYNFINSHSRYTFIMKCHMYIIAISYVWLAGYLDDTSNFIWLSV